MSMHLYEISSKLLGDTVGKVNDNLTSVVLAASVITLTLGYVSKMLLRQSTDTGLVSQLRNGPKMVVEMVSLSSSFTVFLFLFCRNIHLTFPPASPSWVMPLHLGKVPLNFLKMLMKK